MARKLGLLGFLDIQFPHVQKAPNETEVEYQNRQKQFLQNVAQDVANNITQGVFLHFEGTKAEFKDISNGNGREVKEIIELLERWTIEGAKSQPALLGFSTGYTETWATVALHTFISQLQSIQNIIKRFLEYTYRLHVVLKGYDVDDVKIIFNDLPDFQPQNKAQADLFEAQKLVQLLQAGIISVEEARKELGLGNNG